MGVFRRISDIISANLHDMVEGLEDPETMLRQVIREMEQSISEATRQTAKAMANEKTLLRELERNRQQVDAWQSRAESAVKADDDELAGKALSRKNEYMKVVTALEDQIETAREASGTLRRQLDAMKAKLAEAKRNLATLSARKRAAEFRKRMETCASGISPEIDDDAFAKFERLKAKVEQAEAEAEALAELRTGTVEEEPAAEDVAEEDLDVAAELAELKKKLKS
ncbi:MAG: PspA/IM30 family protein [Planctomycetota bacterium]|jgi:phage shock protein A